MASANRRFTEVLFDYGGSLSESKVRQSLPLLLFLACFHKSKWSNM
jgi:hypothetical protein